MRGFAGAEVARIGVGLKGKWRTFPLNTGRGEAADTESIGPRHAHSGRRRSGIYLRFDGITNIAVSQRRNGR
ncbi:hypothetical protein ACVWWO_006059 [Bradyrhizobium sp. F1.13.1]